MNVLDSRSVSIDKIEADRLVKQLGVSDATAASATVFIDDKNYVLTLGVTYPARTARRRYRRRLASRPIAGPVVRISSRVRGRRRSDQSMNRVLVHELEHVAQIDRRDIRSRVGHRVAIGVPMFGLVVGAQWGDSSWQSIGTAILLGIVGYGVGYQLAPHERQARRRARMVVSTAISSKP